MQDLDEDLEEEEMGHIPGIHFQTFVTVSFSWQYILPGNQLHSLEGREGFLFQCRNWRKNMNQGLLPGICKRSLYEYRQVSFGWLLAALWNYPQMDIFLVVCDPKLRMDVPTRDRAGHFWLHRTFGQRTALEGHVWRQMSPLLLLLSIRYQHDLHIHDRYEKLNT